jgi:HTH-type transcriptional regulator, competence development regulator
MTFGEHIRHWREERGIGLRQFAKAVGVSPTFVSKMERGLGPLPGEATLCKMAAFFGKNPDEFFAMADKVASDVLAIITREPAYAHFLRAHAHLMKDQWETLTKSSLLCCCCCQALVTGFFC